MSDSSKIDEENFCYYPFNQLLFQPTGVISPCCWNQGYVLGKVPDKSLQEIWNDEPAQNLRREFLEGRPVSCKQQMSHIGCHRYSRRDDSKQRTEYSAIQTAAPRRFDLRLNGKCNLMCVMCDVWQQPNGVYDDSSFWTKGPTEIFPHLLEIDMLGGEPFIQQDTYRLIDEVTSVNQECQWAFVTNGHYKFGGKIRERLEKIKLRWIQISLDSLRPETYKNIRVGGDLSKPLATIEALIQYREERAAQGRPFKFLVSMCVQKQNWKEIDSFIEFTHARKIDLALQFAYSPHKVSLLDLPEAGRQEVLAYLVSLVPKFGRDILHPIMGPLIDSLGAKANGP